MLKKWRNSSLWWFCETVNLTQTDMWTFTKLNPRFLYYILSQKCGSSLAWLELLGMASTIDPHVPSRPAASWQHSLLAHVPVHLCTQKILPILSLPPTVKKRGRNNPEVRTTDLVGQVSLTGHCLDTCNSEGNRYKISA